MPNGATTSPIRRYSFGVGEAVCSVISVTSNEQQATSNKAARLGSYSSLVTYHLSLNINVNALILARGRDAHQVADGFSNPPAAPDHFASLIGRDSQLIRDRIAAGALFDLHSFRVINQITGHVLK